MTTETEQKKEYLLDRLGGDAALDAAVELFYDKLLADENLIMFFKGIDMDRLLHHQKQFMKLAFTEIPENKNVPKLILSRHERLFAMGLNETHFDMVAGHLVATLQELQVKQAQIDEVVAVVGPLRPIFEQGAKDFAAKCDKRPPIFDRIGGDAAVDAAVDEFYVRVLSDPDLVMFFEGVDMNKLKHHQRRFFKLAFTEIPKSVDVPKLILEKHSRLFEMGLNETHFDLVAGHLVETLQHLGVDASLIRECVAVISPLRDVFQKGAAQVACEA